MKFVPNTVSRTVARSMLSVKKQSPHILFAAGVVGIVGGTVLACRATLKLGPVLDDFKADIDDVKTLGGRNGNLVHKNYPEAEYKKDLTYVYVKDTAKVLKLYAPAIIVTTASIAALTGSHVTLTRRNSALTATVATLTHAYNEYRDRVREEVGAEKELELYHAAQKLPLADVNGKVSELYVADPNRWSPYARFFDEASPNWQKSPELNRVFVQCQQNYCNMLLQSNGHIFLNEVYDKLGIPRSQAGSVVGWVISDKGDNYVDFGMFEAANSAFINGWERTILLDFNVDGVIFDKI